MVIAPPSAQSAMNSSMPPANDAATRKPVPATSPTSITGRGPIPSSTRPETMLSAAPSRYEAINAALAGPEAQPSSSWIGPTMIPKP